MGVGLHASGFGQLEDKWNSNPFAHSSIITV